MRELRKLVNVQIKLAASGLHNLAQEVVRTLPGIQKDGGRQFMDLVAYSYGQTHNAVMATLSAMIAENVPAPSARVLAANLRTFLDYYKEIQYRLVPILEAWGSNDRIDDAIQHWVPSDRAAMTAFQEFVSEYVRDGYLKTESWSMGFADSRFSKFVEKRDVRTRSS